MLVSSRVFEWCSKVYQRKYVLFCPERVHKNRKTTISLRSFLKQYIDGEMPILAEHQR